MPPKVALILCTGFVGWLLYLDHKLSKRVSGWLWIPTVGILCSASRAVASWFGGGGSEYEGSSLDRVVFLVLLFLGLVALLRRGISWPAALQSNRWLWVVYAFALVSLVWAWFPFICFKRWLRIAVLPVLGLVVATEINPVYALEAIVRRSAYVLIPYSILLIKYFPSLGVDFNVWSGIATWIGVTYQKNSLGRLCMISGFGIVWMYIRRRSRSDIHAVKGQNLADALVLGMICYILRGTSGGTSVTSILGLLIGLFILWSLYWMRKQGKLYLSRMYSLVIVGVLAVGIALPFVGTGATSEFVSAVGRDATFTGRTEIWHDLLPKFFDDPLLGRGIGGFWLSAFTHIRFTFNDAHNGYLDVMLDLGVVGLAFLVCLLLSIFRDARLLLRTNDFDLASFAVCFLIMACIHNVTEGSFLRGASHIWTLTVVLAPVCGFAVKRQVELSRRALCPKMRQSQTVMSNSGTVPQRT
jgi:O-antigen ligase